MKRILIILGMLILAGPACSAPAQPAAAPTIAAVAPEPVQATAVPATEVVTSEPAILSEVENDVAVRAQNETDWKSVSTVELVSDGASVRTQADSNARLDLPNGNVLLIGPDTIFVLSNFDGQDWVIFLEQGDVVLEVTAGNLGKSVISTPIGIAWPTGSSIGVSWAPLAGLTLETETEYHYDWPYMEVGCFTGSCAAAPGKTLQKSALNEITIADSLGFGSTTPIMNLDVMGAYGTTLLREKEQITVEKPTESEVKASQIKIGLHMDFGSDSSTVHIGNWATYAPFFNKDTGEITIPVNLPQCDLFQGAAFSHVYGEWLPGAPLAVNIKMPASVAWQDLNYYMKIGDMEGQACAPLEGNNTRLSCKIKLPSEYVGTYKYHLSLGLDGCEEPIYTKGPLSLPVPEPSDEPKDEGEEDTNSCDAYAPDQIACESHGGIWDLVFFSCTCP
ncbi:MAG: hypothetical protein HN736_13550 [Anaerolineae bacterium]|jgi:hypothetical protein|nr:hypothetical protein [Anaerolineae bacterium]MBT4310951.1 hypothetical protein [Anaerolineae bacterium]MBT4458421.1 hypothetical protein [Anaerolineae bacterium]MBT4843773.1 hypothetical protein [Anaerolineae bacterium]MBT6061895.1 hypothetical protein [Anaerolineae bacterium]